MVMVLLMCDAVCHDCVAMKLQPSYNLAVSLVLGVSSDVGNVVE